MPEAPERLTKLLPLIYEGMVRRSLEEDLGRAGDITTDAIAPPGALASGSVVARAPGRIAGLDVALSAFRQLDPAISSEMSMRHEDLGAAVATNHDRPPLGTQVIGPSLNGQLFILKDNLLYYSLGNQPEYWPPTYYLEVTPPQFPLMAACFFGGNLLVASQHEIFVISGSSSASDFAQPMSAVKGTHSRNCFLPVKGVGVFHLGSDGIYLYTMAQDQNVTDANFKPIFEGTAKGSIPGIDKSYLANCLMMVWQNKFWFGYPAIGEVYCKDFLVFDLETKRWTHYQYPSAIRSMVVDYYNSRLLGGDESGYIWVLDDATITTDEGTAITWDLQSKDFVQFPKYFPRYARWDVNLNNGVLNGGASLPKKQR